MASVFGRGRSKSASKSKDQKEKDLRKGPEKETQFIEQGAIKKAGQGKHAKETVSVSGQDGIELSSGLEASAGDHKKKEKKERGFSFGKSKGPKKKPPDQAATSPSKKPSAAKVFLGAGISARISSKTSCDSHASGSSVSPVESLIRFRELEAKLRSSQDMSLKRLEEMQHSEQEHEKALEELKGKYTATLEEKANELEGTKSEFETLSVKEQELLHEKTEEFRALQHQRQLQESHGQEEEKMADKYEAQLWKVHQQHQAERERLLNESQQLLLEQKRHLKEMADKVKHYEEQQQEVLKHECKVVQEQESQLQSMRNKLAQKEEDLQVKLHEKDKQAQCFLQRAEKQLLDEQERHDQEKENLTEKYEARLLEATQQHQAEKGRLLSESQLIQNEVRALEEKLHDRDEELKRLRQQATGSLVPLQTSLKYDDLPSDTDPRVEIAMLKEVLKIKDHKIEVLQVQIRSFEAVIKHAKEQSKQVLKLKQELKTVQKDKGTSKAKTELLEQTEDGTDLVAQLEQLKEELSQIENEKQKVEEQRDGFQREVEQLHADLAVTDNEGAKEEKKQKIPSTSSQASGSLASASTKQVYHEENRIRELEALIRNSEDISLKRIDEEMQQSEKEHQRALAELNEKRAAVLEEKVKIEIEKQHSELMIKLSERDRKMQQEQKQKLETELEVKEKEHKVEMDKKQKQLEAKLREVTSALQKQLQVKQEEITAQDSKVKRLQEELAQSEIRFSEELQQVTNRHMKVVQDQESELQKLREKLSKKEEDLQLMLHEKEEQFRHFVQNAEKLLQEQRVQLQEEQEKHAQEKKQTTEEYQAHLQEAIQQHQAEKDRLLRESQLLVHTAEKRLQEEQAQLQEEREKHAQEKRQTTENYEAQLQEAIQQHLEEKDILLRESQLQLAEKDELLRVAQDEKLQLTHDKDRFIQSLLSEKEELRQQILVPRHVRQEQPQQPQQTHQSEFWEVPREHVICNMQNILGIGAWGYVVEGTFRGQRVAVKCMHDMIRSSRVVEIMRKEIGIMAQVRHPNLVLLIAAVIDTENDPLIVTELLDISLRRAYENNRLQGSSKLSMFRDIAAALNYLHLHHCGEIIHRDVSSANVLLEAKPNNQWKAKLSDFGSAKLATKAKTKGPGAPVYSAPEILKEMGIPQTAKVDVYSYGVLLCEVTVEQFPDEESLASMMQVIQGKWAFMHCLITSCVQNHPDSRPTMSYVLSEFERLRPQN